jgi:hypothetical protein
MFYFSIKILVISTLLFNTFALSSSSSILLDGTAAFHSWDGFGGLSAGASSRLLRDYPEPQRSDILDLLYKPSHGAGLKICKIEIGGDVMSTDGTEASFQHNRGDINCERGYELWLASEALKRNPNIATFGLEWGAPGWIGNSSFFTSEMWQYKVDFCNCFLEVVGRPLDFIGIYNERYWGGTDYIIGLRAALNAAGHERTRIVLPDNQVSDPSLLDAIANNATFSAAFDVAGQHGTPTAIPLIEATNHRYWESESGFSPISLKSDWQGAQDWAKILSRNYINANVTATITWSTIWSVLPGLPYDGRGIMMANTPWSGNFKDNAPLWVSAHYGQFLEIGWRYLLTGRGSGILPPLDGGNGDAGSCVAFVPQADLNDLTLICETIAVSTAGERIFQLTGGLVGPGTIFSVWQTTKGANFVQQADAIVGSDNTLTLLLPSDGIVTASTIHTATHGQPSVPIPPSAPFSLPYRDSFDETVYPYDTYPLYLSDQGGSFACRNGSLVQLVTQRPGGNDWYTTPDPITLLGDYTPWANVTIGVTASIPSISSLDSNLKLQDDPNAYVSTCEDTPKSNSAQIWDLGLPYSGYISNSGPGRQTACLNLYGCETRMIYYECCQNCGCSNGDGFLFTLQSNGTITSPLYPGLCATILSTDNVTVSLEQCDSTSSFQLWTHLPTKQLRNLGTMSCLTSSFGINSIYVQVCSRVTEYTGFAGIAPIPGYCLKINSTGFWEVSSLSLSLSNGTLYDYDPTTPTLLSLTTKGDLISATIGSNFLGSWSGLKNYSAGMVAIGSGVHLATFDNFFVEPV